MTPQEAVDLVTTAEAYDVKEEPANIFVVWLSSLWLCQIDSTTRRGIFWGEEDWVELPELECARILNDVSRRENAAPA